MNAFEFADSSPKEMADMNDDKWLVVHGVNPNINQRLKVDYLSFSGVVSNRMTVPTFWDAVNKYRLHNGPGYKDGIAIDNDTLKADEKKGVAEFMHKPEWVEGDAPPRGAECEAVWDEAPDGGDRDWTKVIYKGGYEYKMWFSYCDNNSVIEVVIPAHNVTFRPILTPKQRTIEALCAAIDPDEPDTESFNAEFHRIIGSAYDLGFITLPGESK